MRNGRSGLIFSRNMVKIVCCLLPLITWAGFLYAQVPDTAGGRFFVEVNTSVRRLNMGDFNKYFGYTGLFKNPINNEVELSLSPGLFVGKNQEGFIKLGYHYIPDFNRTHSLSTTSNFENDSFVITSIWNFKSRFRIRSYSLEGGYIYDIGKIKGVIGLGLTLNSLRREIELVQYTHVKTVSSDGTVYQKTARNQIQEDKTDVTNRGFGGLAYGSIQWPVSRHLSLSASLRFFLAGILIRWPDGKPVRYGFVQTPYGEYEEYLVANMSGASLSSGIRYRF